MSMLEANTDRSYFMIGAVIVAAIVIGLTAWLFRDYLFSKDDANNDGQPDGAIIRMFESLSGVADNALGSTSSSAGGAGGG